MNTLDEIEKICTKYLFDYNLLNATKNIDEIIDQVENLISEQKQYIEKSDLLHTELLLLKRKIDLEEMLNDNNFKKNEKELYQELKIKRIDDIYVYEGPIIISSICYLTEYNFEKTIVLNKKKQQKIRDLGYEIKKIEFPVFKELKILYCDGLHANLDPATKEFCLSDLFFNCDINCENINDVFDTLSCMKLHDSYLIGSQLGDILDIII